MGVAHYTILHLIQKVVSWLGGGGGFLDDGAGPFMSLGKGGTVCWQCQECLDSPGHWCRSCGRLFCRKCMHNGSNSGLALLGLVQEEEEPLVLCKLCFRAMSSSPEVARPLRDHKVGSLALPENGPKSPLPLSRCSIDKLDPFGERQQFSSPTSLSCSTYRNFEEDEGYESSRQFLTPTSELSQDAADCDTMSMYTGNELSSFRSTPAHSPLPMREKGFYAPYSPKNYSFQYGYPSQLQKSRVDLEYPVDHSNDCMSVDAPVYPDRESPKVEQPLDLGKNGLIWYPPPPEEEVDDEETGFFRIDDEDDEPDDLGKFFTTGNFYGDLSWTKEKHNEGQKESLKSAVREHFRALVSQLLKGEDLTVSNGEEDWLELVSLLAWQAANFVRPDTSNGGSMDPGTYVKVKCIASGKPSDSTLVKGVVFTKNVKHKRMISKHKNPRVLILGGALDFQKAPNGLASIDALLGQETDHLKMVLAKIENLRPNVLLVEKSVSSYAQDRLLAKNEISLVPNVKKSLLERISRCTGAEIVPTIDSISSARLGHCESFQTEKFYEDCASFNQLKKSFKTLMFFEGCPKRLGCTVLLRGASREELKKVKHVIQYASFAAYHLSLETSFLADEGATVPKLPVEPSVSLTKKHVNANGLSMCSSSVIYDHGNTRNYPKGDDLCNNLVTESVSSSADVKHVKEELVDFKEQGHRYSVQHVNSSDLFGYPSAYSDDNYINPCHSNDSVFPVYSEGSECPSPLTNDIIDPQDVNLDHLITEKCCWMSDELVESTSDHKRKDTYDMNEVPMEYLSAADNHQSILVSLSSTCIPKGTMCERSQLFRIKFYGSFDKPLGRYLRDDLFNQTFRCKSCKEPTESHVRCYTHQQGSLSISVNRLPSMKLPGECDGKIWMWHRCLKCEMKDGVPPAACRVIMSDAAWGLSFGKFLELSFSNHATANRIANCGHSLQKDCLRFYGFGNMVAFFRHSPVDILSVQLPPTVLDFTCQFQKEWMKKEVDLIYHKMDLLCAEISKLLQSFRSFDDKSFKMSIESQIMELKDMLKFERNEYEVRLQNVVGKNIQTADVLELNRLRRELLLYAYLWDDRLHSLNSFYNAKFSTKVVVRLSQTLNNSVFEESREELHSQIIKFGDESEETSKRPFSSATSQQLGPFNLHKEFTLQVLECNSSTRADMDFSGEQNQGVAFSEDINLFFQKNFGSDEQHTEAKLSFLENSSSTISDISDRIDSAWTGSGQLVMDQPKSYPETHSPRSSNAMDDSYYRKIGSPVRVYSFDSALQLRKRLHGGLLLPPSDLSPVKSVDSSRALASTVKDPAVSIRRAYSQGSHRAAYRSNMQLNCLPLSFSSSFHMFGEGVRLLLPQTGLHDIVFAVYDDEPTSIISYALTSQQYNEFILANLVKPEESNATGNQVGYWAPSFGAHQLITQFTSDDFADESQTIQRRLSDSKDPHFRMSFDDDCSCPTDKTKFSVTCYFAKQFDALRKKCCPNEMDFVRSLSRCKKWNAQGGKSNVYFAKSLDDRFIIKQVTKTELDSFEVFAPKYFNYLTDAVASGSPTCLAKVLGIYQVTVKHLKGGREVKMDLMVMENIFHNRNISRVYDLKGSLRSRYNPDTSGNNKVLLDLNLLETIVTEPIFLGSYAKRSLERAVWNDTSFLASIAVMDYSLLVGVDEEEKQLVIGIIDFMRQYTWDKQLESWVKASGILGGPKNASPTVISPDQYKKRFRKAMSNYFLTVPDQWPS